MKKLTPNLILFLILAIGINSLTMYGCINYVNFNKHIKSVAAISEVFADGQKVTAIAIECDKEIENSKLSRSAFSAEGRTVTNMYANNSAAKASKGVDGKYIIIELSKSDKGALTIVQNGPKSTRTEIKVSLKQLEDITTTDGEKYAPDTNLIVTDRQINLLVDDFLKLEYKDPKTGKTLKYDLFVPKNYDKKKSYPMVLFIHDRGVCSSETDMTLIQGIGGVIWATPSEQAKYECFVLAPQYSSAIVNDNSETTEDVDITVNLINYLTRRYNIDKNRLYATGQSMGCMASIVMNIKYPDLFAASLLVAGQWDPTKVSPMAKDKLWIIVSEGDQKAFPGMNAITATLEKEGAKISRATWNGQSSVAEFASDARWQLNPSWKNSGCITPGLN
jgi:predicted peptidase